MIEEKKKIILNKVNNGIFDLTSEEKYIFKKDTNFFIEVINICSKFSNFNHFEWLVDAHITDINFLDQNFNKQFYLKYILNSIKEECIISYDFIISEINIEMFNDDDLDLLKQACNDIKKNGKDFLCNVSDALEFLNNKDYESISKIAEIGDMDSDNYKILLERLKKEYPLNKYNLTFIKKDIYNFKDKLDDMNIIYSLLYCSVFHDDNLVVINNIIKRLENGEKIPYNRELIQKIDFGIIEYDLDSEIYKKLINLLFKNNPFIVFQTTYDQNYHLSSFLPYIKEQIINNLDENTEINSIVSYFAYNDEDIFNKLIETKHYKEALLFSSWLEEFDLLNNYITRTKHEVLTEDRFWNIYNSIKDKEKFIKLIQDNKIEINFKRNVSNELIDFFIDNNCVNIIYNFLCNYNKQAIEYILSEHKDYFINNILNNIEYGTEFLKYHSLNINNDVLNIIFSKDKYYFDEYLKLLNNYGDLDYEIIYNNLISYFSKYLNIDLNKLNKLKDKFGYEIIKYIKEPKIIEILNLDENDFLKLLNLFSNDLFSMKELENAYDSIIQLQFTSDNQSDLAIFHNILVSIELNNLNYINYINQIVSVIDSNALIYFNNVLNIQMDNPYTYLINIIENIKNNNDRNNNINILHQICTYYLDKKRGEYKNSKDIREELDLSYTYDQKQLNTAIIKKLLSDNSKFMEDVINEILDNNELKKSFNINYKLIYETIMFYTNSIEKNQLTNDLKVIQKLIPIVRKYAEKNLINIDNNLYEFYAKKVVQENDNIKKNYVVDLPFDFYKVLLTLDIEKIKNDLLDSDDNYQLFINVMKKLKLNNIPESLYNYIIQRKEFDFDSSTIGAFINYFTSIMKDYNSSNKYLNLATTIKLSSVYDSVSSIYKLILGEEDYKLIKGNPGRNEAHNKLENDQRLIEATELMLKSFDRKYVTIPTFNEIIETSNNKKIRCVVGNFTNPRNLTFGERTESCMRIGGVGESLFYFCNNNENGFHIRFEDPDNNEFISRVSGFRNGNTVFLNELRYSVLDNYDDKDILEITKIVANKLIEYSKHTDYPIENVVVHNDFVTKNEFAVNLNVSNIKNGLPYFYSDVNQNAVVLASTNKEGFVPLDLNPNHITRYQTARDIPRFITSKEEFIKRSGRINAIIETKKLGEMDYIPNYILKNGFNIGIVGDDYYVYLDNNLNIVSENIGIDERSYKEIEEAILYLETYKQTLSSKNNLLNK